MQCTLALPLTALFATVCAVSAAKKSKDERKQIIRQAVETCKVFPTQTKWIRGNNKYEKENNSLNCVLAESFIRDKEMTYADFEPLHNKIQSESGSTEEAGAGRVAVNNHQAVEAADAESEAAEKDPTGIMPNDEAVKKRFPGVYEESTKDGTAKGTPPNPYEDSYWPMPTRTAADRRNIRYNYRKHNVKNAVIAAVSVCYGNKVQGETVSVQRVVDRVVNEVTVVEVTHNLNKLRIQRAYGVPSDDPNRKQTPEKPTAEDIDEARMLFYCALGVAALWQRSYSLQKFLEHWFMERLYNYSVAGGSATDPEADKKDYPWLGYKHDILKNADSKAIEGVYKLHKIIDEKVRRVTVKYSVQ